MSNTPPDCLSALQWKPKITDQWAIPNYGDPWSRDQHKETYYARKLAGLTSRCEKSIWVFDYITKTRKKYDSIQECAKDIKIRSDTIGRALKTTRWIATRYATGRTIADLEVCIKTKRLKAREAQPIKCLDMKTGIVVVFKSKSEASKTLHANKDNIHFGYTHRNRYKFMEVNDEV